MAVKIINGEKYYSIPDAARIIGVSRISLLRWIKEGMPKRSTSTIQLNVLQDPMNNHYYVSSDSAEALAKRHEPYEPTQGKQRRRIEKKIWPEFFNLILSGKKQFELRLADFECEEGDILVLREWNPRIEQFTGRVIVREVTYVLRMRKMPQFWPVEDVEQYGLQIIAFRP